MAIIKPFKIKSFKKKDPSIEFKNVSLGFGNRLILNNINFSANLGVIFSYKFDKKWALNFSPMLKSHLNTFNNNSNGFKPYYFGVYSGINLNF